MSKGIIPKSGHDKKTLNIYRLRGVAVVLWNSIDKWDMDEGDGNLILKIIASAVYGLAGIVIIFPVIWIWMKYYENGEICSLVSLIVMIGIAITFGVVGWIQDQ